MRLHLSLVALLFSAALSGCVVAPARNPEVVEGFARRNNLEVQKSFELSPSIRGYAIENVKGGKGIFYVVDGKYGFVGNMVGVDGESLTKTHLQTFVYDLPGAYARLQKEAFPITDDPGSTIYGFYEPQCNFCVHAIDDMAKAGVKVQWVPVLFFGETSINALAAIYASSDEQAALAAAAAAQREHKLAEWVSSQTYGTDNLKAAVDATARHESIMKQAGFSGTPMFLAKVRGDVIPLTSGDILSMRADYLRTHSDSDEGSAARSNPSVSSASPTTLSAARPPLTPEQLDEVLNAIAPTPPANLPGAAPQ